MFLPVIDALDELKDSGSNFQLTGRIIQARYPRITVVHGLEHVLSLVFEYIAAFPVIKVTCDVILLKCFVSFNIPYF